MIGVLASPAAMPAVLGLVHNRCDILGFIPVRGAHHLHAHTGTSSAVLPPCGPMREEAWTWYETCQELENGLAVALMERELRWQYR